GEGGGAGGGGWGGGGGGGGEGWCASRSRQPNNTPGTSPSFISKWLCGASAPHFGFFRLLDRGGLYREVPPSLAEVFREGLTARRALRRPCIAHRARCSATGRLRAMTRRGRSAPADPSRSAPPVRGRTSRGSQLGILLAEQPREELSEHSAAFSAELTMARTGKQEEARRAPRGRQELGASAHVLRGFALAAEHGHRQRVAEMREGRTPRRAAEHHASIPRRIAFDQALDACGALRVTEQDGVLDIEGAPA